MPGVWVETAEHVCNCAKMARMRDRFGVHGLQDFSWEQEGAMKMWR